MEMDQPLAGTDGRPEEVLHLTALSREVAERALVVDRTLHGELVPLAPDVVRLIVTPTAQPDQVLGHVSPTLRAVDAVVDVDARAHVTGCRRSRAGSAVVPPGHALLERS
jgi:hypothetical protein